MGSSSPMTRHGSSWRDFVSTVGLPSRQCFDGLGGSTGLVGNLLYFFPYFLIYRFIALVLLAPSKLFTRCCASLREMVTLLHWLDCLICWFTATLLYNFSICDRDILSRLADVNFGISYRPEPPPPLLRVLDFAPLAPPEPPPVLAPPLAPLPPMLTPPLRTAGRLNRPCGEYCRADYRATYQKQALHTG